MMLKLPKTPVVAVLLTLLLGFMAGLAPGQLVIDVDTTFDGSTLTVGPPPNGLFVTHTSNDPLLTLTNGANTAGVEGFVVGLLSGETGNLLINEGSVLTNSGSGGLGTFGSQTVLRGHGYLGFNANSTGIATVMGAGSSWTNNGALLVGAWGTGQLNISMGGVVTNNSIGSVGAQAGAVGNALVTGVGSQWNAGSILVVGAAGQGQLSITNGGLVSNATGYIGNVSGSSGTANITGNGSSWANNGDLSVGRGGEAQLILANGGSVSNVNGIIGELSSSNGMVGISGTESTWINSGTLRVGAGGVGLLIIEDGGTVSNTIGTIGDLTTSNGTVHVKGANSSWVNTGVSGVRVGNQGTGEMIISDGGSVENSIGGIGIFAGSNGIVHVKGANSSWVNTNYLRVGSSGTGGMIISDGGFVSSTVSLSSEEPAGSIGWNNGSQGSVLVTGIGSLWQTNGSIAIGYTGDGMLNIEDGGRVLTSGTNSSDIGRARNGFTGISGNGIVNVTGIGSSWISSGGLAVARSTGTTGSLTVSAGGFVSNGGMSIGNGPNAHGTVVVSGVDSQLLTDFLNVGGFGEGHLTISDGGSVTGTHSQVGLTASSHGTVNITGMGSTMTVDNLYIGGTSTQAAGQGIVNVVNGGKLIVNSQLKVWNTGRLNLDGGQLSVPYYEVNGTLSGSGTINGRIVVFGKISPGDVGFGVTGSLKTGNLGGGSSVGGTDGQLDIKDTSTVSIQVGGTSGPGDSSDLFDIIDGLNESGLLIDGGFLELALINDFIPQSTDTFDIFQSFATVSGAFGNTVFGGPGQLERILFDQGSFAIEYGESYVRLSDFQMIPEPSAGLLVGLTLTGIGLYRRRYRCQVC